jgi:FtsP/CotA-like multicopper oxidase with cupredoxin domain
MVRVLGRLLTPALLMVAASQAFAQSTSTPTGYGYPTPPPGSGSTSAVCPRFPAGSPVLPPPDVWSFNGFLSVFFNYNTTVDAQNRNLFCFQTNPFAWEGPTLRINPGDVLGVTVTNNVPNGTVQEQISSTAGQCGDLVRYDGSLNIHYHGAPVSPACHQDQVIHTLINNGETFNYFIPWPYWTPPGLYWYHTHVHGNADPTVQGGASGLLSVQGLQNYFPWLAGMRERMIILRDQSIPGLNIFTAGTPCPNGSPTVVPTLDLTVNYVPLNTGTDCSYTPAVIEAIPGGYELWRVAASGGDSIFDLQVLDDQGNPQTLLLVALDADPTGSENGAQRGTPVPTTDVVLAPAARAEFVVATPPPGKTWQFITRQTGFLGFLGNTFEATETRTIAQIKTDQPQILPLVPPVNRFVPPAIPPALKLANQTPMVKRTLYFDEPSAFLMAVVIPPGGSCPDPTPGACITDINGNLVYEKPFDISNPPAITVTQGAIEEWTIENHTTENHEFHFHQLHFLVMSQNNFPTGAAAVGNAAPYQVGQFLDMIQVPAAPNSFFNLNSGSFFPPYSPPAGQQPPSVTIRLDFTGSDIGDFVFHCHILAHEDAGMMQIIRVLPPTAP